MPNEDYNARKIHRLSRGARLWIRLGPWCSHNGIYIERLNNDLLRFGAVYDGGFDLVGDIEISIPDFLELIGEKGEKPQWISVEDRLPDIPGRFLVLWRVPLTSHLSHLTAYFRRLGVEHWWENERRQKIEVAYWMPLPEMPEES